MVTWLYRMALSIVFAALTAPLVSTPLASLLIMMSGLPDSVERLHETWRFSFFMHSFLFLVGLWLFTLVPLLWLWLLGPHKRKEFQSLAKLARRYNRGECSEGECREVKELIRTGTFARAGLATNRKTGKLQGLVKISDREIGSTL